VKAKRLLETSENVHPSTQFGIPEDQNSILSWDIPVVSYKYHKMKWNRSLNTTNGLLAKMESSYVTTCFGLHLWPSSGYFQSLSYFCFTERYYTQTALTCLIEPQCNTRQPTFTARIYSPP